MNESTKFLTPIAFAVVIKDAFDGPSIWIQKRSGDASLSGFYEFPGGKIERGESACEAARRELKEESVHEFNSSRARLLSAYQYDYEDRSLLLHAVTFYLRKGEEWTGVNGEWVKFAELERSSFLTGSHRALDVLEEALTDLQRVKDKKEEVECLL